MAVRHAVVLFAAVAALAIPSRAVVAQDPCQQFFPPPPTYCYAVTVTPKGDATATRTANTHGYTQVFTVTNSGGLGEARSFSCQGTSGAVCDSVRPTSEAFPGDGNVTAYYSVGAPGTGTLTVSASGANSSDDGWVSVPIQSYGVTVTPDGGSAPTRVPNTGPYKLVYTVHNTGSGTESYAIACSSTGTVNCGTIGPTSVTVAGGATGSVAVSYTVGATSTGSLSITATSAHDNDGGSYNITVGQTAGAPIVDLTPYNYADQDYAACAASCFAMVYGQSTVPYFSLDAPRSATLAYNSDRVNPHPFVHVNVSPDPSYGSTPSEYHLQLLVNGTVVPFINGDQTLRFTYPGSSKVRLGGQFDATNLPTGVDSLDIVVSALYPGNTLISTDIPTKLVVVNQTDASLGKGWTLAGVGQAYMQPDSSVLITDGVGGARYFWNVGGTYIAPAGVFASLTGNPSSGWTEAAPDSSKLMFNTAGRLTTLTDRVGVTSTVVYDGSNRVSQLKDPLGLALTFHYGTGQDTIVDSGSPARTTLISVNGSQQLAAITDPDGVATKFAYDSRLELTKLIDRRGDTTSFGYDTLSRKLLSTTAPKVAIYGFGSLTSPVATQKPWQLTAVPYTTTATTAATPPLPDTIRARVTDPLGDSTRFTVNRWGTPLQVTDALGGVTTLTYDANDLLTLTQTPAGDQDTVVYNASGLPTYIAGSNLSATNIHYGSRAQPDSIWGVGRPRQRFAVNPLGEVTQQILGKDTAGLIEDTIGYTYETYGRQSTVLDARGDLIGKWLYNGANGNMSTDSVPGGRVIHDSSDSYGRVVSIQYPGVPRQRTVFDVLNRPDSSFAGPSAHSIVTTYDSLFVRSVTDAKGQVYGFTHNALGWVTQRTDPSGHSDQYAFDKLGDLKRWINRRGDSLLYTYDALQRMASKTGSNTSTDSWTYSSNGRVLTSTSAADTETTYLNLAGTPDSVETRIAGQTFWRRYRYTTAALLDSEDISGGGITFKARKYTYNTAFGVLTGIHLGGAVTAFGVDKDLQDTATTFPGGDKVTRLIDPLHATTEISTSAAYNSTIARSIGFDSLNRVQIQAEGNGGTAHQFTYDLRGRLTSDSTMGNSAPSDSCSGNPPPIVNADGNSCVTGGSWGALSGNAFSYDSAGNRTDLGGGYRIGSRDSVFGGCSYVEDADGNVTSRTCGGSTVAFAWSAESRLTSYTVGGQTVNLKYNAEGQLVRKDSSTATKSNFLWDGDNLLAEVNAAGTGSVAEYSYYGTDQPHSLIVGGTEYNAQTDGLGDVIALTDNSANVQRTYGYDAWGAMTSGTDGRPFANADRARWKGALWLGPELDVYYMRNRWYETGTGRFLSEDPAGLGGGPNPYVYASSDPVNGFDPRGLEEVCRQWVMYYHNEISGWDYGFRYFWVCTGDPDGAPSDPPGSPQPSSGTGGAPAQGPQAPPSPRPPCNLAGNAPPPSYYAGVARVGASQAPYLVPAMIAEQFRKGGSLDAQAQGAKPAYANYVFGVYFAAGGFSLNATLNLANSYGQHFSHYPASTPMDAMYTHIPASNVISITQGYNEQKAGTTCTTR